MSDVRDNPATSRFEMASGGAVAVVEYRRAGGRIVLAHTEVPEALSGKDFGSKLVRGVLDSIPEAGGGAASPSSRGRWWGSAFR